MKIKYKIVKFREISNFTNMVYRQLHKYSQAHTIMGLSSTTSTTIIITET